MTGTAVQPLIPSTSRRGAAETADREQQQRQQQPAVVAPSSSSTTTSSCSSSPDAADAGAGGGVVSVGRTYSTESEEQPWDQQRPKKEGGRGRNLEGLQEEEEEEKEEGAAMRTDSSRSRSRSRRGIGASTTDSFSSEEEYFEDGDLPSLTTSGNRNYRSSSAKQQQRRQQKFVGGRIVNGQRTTARPLSPPSQAGLGGGKSGDISSADLARKNRKFWNQFEDEDEDDEGYGDDEARDPTRGSYSPGVPHDELPRKSARRAASVGSGADGAGTGGGRPYQRDDCGSENEESGATQSHISGDTSYYEEPSVLLLNHQDQEDTFCGQALDAIGDMCGAGLGITDGSEAVESKKLKNKSEKKNKAGTDSSNKAGAAEAASSTARAAGASSVGGGGGGLDIDEVDDDQIQEHTAIEVEFVEPPTPPPPASASLIPERKNAFLTALARKAKAEFEGKKVDHNNHKPVDRIEVASSSAAGSSASFGNNDNDTDSKKLSSPSSSSSPADAAAAPSDVYNSFSASDKRKFLKLINSGESPAAAAEQIVKEQEQRSNNNKQRQAGTDGGNSASANRSSRLAFWKKNQLPATANAGTGTSRKEKVQTLHPPETVRSAPEDQDPPEPLFAEKVPNMDKVQIVKPAVDKFEEVISSPSLEDVEEILAEEEGPTGGSMPKKIKEADVTHPESDSSDADEAVPFAKSGINYYDAVRKDESDDDSLLDGDFPSGNNNSNAAPSSSKASTQKGGIRSLSRSTAGGARRGATNLVSKGFALLEEKRSRSVPRIRIPDTDDEEEDVGGGDAELPSRQGSRPPAAAAAVPPPPAAAAAAASAAAAPRPLSSTREGVGSNGASRQEVSATPAVAAKSKQTEAELSDQDEPSCASHSIAKSKTEEEEAAQRRTVQSLSNASIPSEDTDSIGQIEKTLLRPVPKETDDGLVIASKSLSPAARGSRKYQPIERFEPRAEPTAVKIRESQKEEAKNDKEKASIDVDAMEISMNEYMNSTDVYASVGASSTYDNVSVYTSGTGITGVSSYTQSTRVRRPGAAKVRIAQAKRANEIASKKNGWHESIRAVAASTNRVWDPKHGWVDYKDRDTSAEEVADTSNERIRINLEKSVRPRTPKSEEMANSDSADPAVDVGFPPEWEDEREKMLAMRQEEAILSARNNAPDSNSPASEVLPGSPAMNRGWVESMRAASASITGGTWDPETGWRNNGRVQQDLDESVDVIRDPREIEDDTESADPAYETTDAGPSARVDVSTEQQVAVPNTRQIDNGEKKLNQWMASKVEQTPRAEPLTECSDRTVTSAEAAEKYMQIGDNGSVRSFVKGEKANPREARPHGNLLPPETSDEEQDEDGISGVTKDSQSFPPFAAEQSTPKSPVINVVTEKVGRDEFNLFHHDDPINGRRKKSETVGSSNPASNSPIFRYGHQSGVEGSTSRIPAPSSPGTHSGHSRLVGSASISSAPSSPGRCSGPVDVDEVDVTDDSEDDDRNSSCFHGSSTTGSSSPYTKKVPKLQRSKRDTSPIRDRQLISTDVAEEGLSPTNQAHAEEGTPVPVTPEGRNPTNQVTPEASYNLYGNNKKVSYSLDNNAEDVTAESLRYGSGGSGLSESKSDHSNSSVSIVKERLQQWEERSRSPGNSFDNAERKVEVTPEWKAFLGKKVKAERQAAAKQDMSLRSAENPEDKSPRIHSASPGKYTSPRELVTGAHNEEDDSLFQFPGQGSLRTTNHDESTSASALDVSVLSPVDTRGEFSDAGTGTSGPYGPDPSDRRSFFKRFAECAAPVMASSTQCTGPLIAAATARQPAKEGGSMPMAHLAFLRQSPRTSESNPSQSSNFVPPTFCGREENVYEDSVVNEYEKPDEVTCDGGKGISETDSTRQQSIAESNSKPRSRSRSRSQSRGREMRGTASSVVSDDGFGAKTAYLEALAMKAAVAKPRKSSRRHSGSSVVSTGSSQHSEKWRAFLDKKKAASTASPLKRTNSSDDVSRAAEKYAAGKVEEMMSRMARSRTAPARSSSSHARLTGVANDGEIDNNEDEVWKHKKAESVKAAEDLAAARVEAMMAALSSSQHSVEEGEI